MNREDIIRMAREVGGIDISSHGWTSWVGTQTTEFLERFAQLVAQAERNKVAQWMIQRSYATGHGDSVEDLLKELEWQVKEACANTAEQSHQNNMVGEIWAARAAAAIRARGQV